jgi:cob(I)alamin adenosyltransferase
MAKGLIHVYYGTGKGKTTAALGLALRACGSGKKVVIVQFLKDTPSGELNSLSCLENTTLLRGKAGKMFAADMDEAEKAATKAIHDANLKDALDMVSSGACDLLILDEAIDAYQLGLLDEELLQSLVTNKPDGLELVITGHKPLDWLCDKADYVTEMRKVKHPYDQGIGARKGIEF